MDLIAQYLNNNKINLTDNDNMYQIRKELDRNDFPEDLKRITNLVKNNPKKNYVLCFDTETTGYSANMDKLLEIAGVIYENGKIVETFKFFTNPFFNPYSKNLPQKNPKLDYVFFKNNKEVPYSALKVHGIDKKKLNDKNALHEDYYVDFIRNLFYENKNITPIAHNFKFDIGFLKRLLSKEKDYKDNIEPYLVNLKSIDTQELLRSYQNDKKNGISNKRKILKAFHNTYKILMNEYQDENNVEIQSVIEAIDIINSGNPTAKKNNGCKAILDLDIKDKEFERKLNEIDDKILKKFKVPNSLDAFYLYALGVLDKNELISTVKAFDRRFHGALIDSYMLGFVYQTYITKINIEAAKIEKQKIIEKEMEQKIIEFNSNKFIFTQNNKNILNKYEVYSKLIKTDFESINDLIINNVLLQVNVKDLNLINIDKYETLLKELFSTNNIIFNINNDLKNLYKKNSKVLKTKLEISENIYFLEFIKDKIYNKITPIVEPIVKNYEKRGKVFSEKQNSKVIEPINTVIYDDTLGRGSIQINDVNEENVIMGTNNVNLGYFLNKYKENSQMGATIPIIMKINDKDYKFDLKCFIKNEKGIFSLYGSKGSILNKMNFKKIDDPFIRIEDLKKYELNNLLFSSGSINGIIETLFKNDQKDEIIPTLKELKKIIPNFTLDAYTNDYVYNNYISYLSKELNIPIIATNTIIKKNDDTHTILHNSLNPKKEEYGSYNPFNVDYSINGLKNNKRVGIYGNILDIKQEIFKGELPTKNDDYLLPKISEKPDIDLIKEATKNLEDYLEKFNIEDKEKYRNRLNYELDIINKMGFPSYMLIVQQIVNFAHENDIAVGHGRGSGAGSLVSFVLKITNLDPIEHDLLFERFLNPERVSMPDIDIDFDLNKNIKIDNIKNEEFKKYLEEKYNVYKEEIIPKYTDEEYQELVEKHKKNRNIIIPNPYSIKITKQNVTIQSKNLLYEYMDKFYGNAYKIITQGTFGALSSIDTVCKILLENNEMVNYISLAKDIKATMPDELGFSLKNEYADAFVNGKLDKDKVEKINPDLYNIIEDYNNIDVLKIIESAINLEKTIRTFGQHPAGVAIDPSPNGVVGSVYLNENGEKVLNHDVNNAEDKTKLVKFDLLGLGTLKFLDKTINLIKKRRNISLDINDLTDKNVYDFIQTGNTVGMFQIESSGMQSLCKRLKPDNFEDLTAVLALYRPGPMKSGMLDDFIARKHGEQELVYFKNEIYELIKNQNKDKTEEEQNKLCEEEYDKVEKILEPILKNTYGVIVYQEQVMAVVQAMGGYSLGEADIIRRAMGKKKMEVMKAHREEFAKRSEVKGINRETAAMVFSLIEKFAGYGFNKSHSAAYAKITYQTAYLKKYYPLEYYNELFNFKENDQDKLAIVVKDLKKYNELNKDNPVILNKIDINKSFEEFTINEKNQILFGLSSIKGLGNKAKILVKNRKNNNIFKSPKNFIERCVVNLNKKDNISKTGFEALVMAGAFDKFNLKSLGNTITERRNELLKLYYYNYNKDAAKIYEITNPIEAAKQEIRITGSFLTADKLPLNTKENINNLIISKQLEPKNQNLIAILVKKPYIKTQPIKEINQELYELSSLKTLTPDDIKKLNKTLKTIISKNNEYIKKTENEKRINTLTNKNRAIKLTLDRLELPNLNDNIEELDILHNSLIEIYDNNLGKNEGKEIVNVPLMLDDRNVYLNIGATTLTDNVKNSVDKLYKGNTIYLSGKWNESEFNDYTTLWVSKLDKIGKVEDNDIKSKNKNKDEKKNKDIER